MKQVMKIFVIKNINKLLLIGIFMSLCFLLIPINTFAATLTLTPSTGSYSVGDLFSVQIGLNTNGAIINGVDINNINFNPVVLQVVDSNPSLSGIQITSSTLMPLTSMNIVNNTTGDITFSQQSNLGQTFNNNSTQTLATINFRAITLGNANLSFDFVSGATTDTNVIGVSSGNITDLLTSVQPTYISVTEQPTQSTKFQTDDRVEVSSGPLNIRQTANGALLGQQSTGAQGTVIGGPEFANNIWWWNINYDDDIDGWSAEQYLQIVTTPQTCTSFTYSAYGTCQSNNTQSRTVTSSSPSECTGGSPVTTQSCTYVPPTTPPPTTPPTTGGGSTGGGSTGGGSTGSGGGGTTPPTTGSNTNTTPPQNTETCVTTNTQTTTNGPTITRWLTTGTTGTDVKNLQIFLNTNGYTITQSGTGSKGNETNYFGTLTREALQKFQCARGIVCAGSPTSTGYGATGPKTRTAITATGGTTQTTCTATSTTPTTPSSGTVTITRWLTVGTTGTDVKNLQIFLNANGYTITQSGTGSKGNETNYFGTLTREALQKFQCARGIVCSGTPTTTGYGATGPKTRAVLTQGN